jgi:hypothetical protein
MRGLRELTGAGLALLVALVAARTALAADALAVDVTQIDWRAKDNQARQEMPVMYLKRASAAELWAGRVVPSHHNTSAPEMVFRDLNAASR